MKTSSSVASRALWAFPILGILCVALAFKNVTVEAENWRLKRKLAGHKTVAIQMDKMGVLKWCDTYRQIIAEAKDE